MGGVVVDIARNAPQTKQSQPLLRFTWLLQCIALEPNNRYRRYAIHVFMRLLSRLFNPNQIAFVLVGMKKCGSFENLWKAVYGIKVGLIVYGDDSKYT
jgi:hypothetical protein